MVCLPLGVATSPSDPICFSFLFHVKICPVLAEVMVLYPRLRSAWAGFWSCSFRPLPNDRAEKVLEKPDLGWRGGRDRGSLSSSGGSLVNSGQGSERCGYHPHFSRAS